MIQNLSALKASLNCRVILLFLTAAIVPACSGGHDSGGSGIYIPPGPIPLPVASDNWSSGSPSANWEVVTSPATVDTTVGAPAGSMVVGNSSGAGEVRTAGVFNVTNAFGGLTIAMDAAYLSESPFIEIYDAANPPPASPVAIAALFDAGVVYRIGADVIQQTVTNDGGFHRYTFTIASGTASWKRDGIIQLTVLSPAVDSVGVYISSGAFASVWVDNFLITAP